MITAKEAASNSLGAVDPLTIKVLTDIERNILSRCEKNLYHYNCSTLPQQTPAVGAEIRSYLENLGYKLKDVYDGSYLDYVHISWEPTKPKAPSFFQRLFWIMP